MNVFDGLCQFWQSEWMTPFILCRKRQMRWHTKMVQSTIGGMQPIALTAVVRSLVLQLQRSTTHPWNAVPSVSKVEDTPAPPLPTASCCCSCLCVHALPRPRPPRLCTTTALEYDNKQCYDFSFLFERIYLPWTENSPISFRRRLYTPSSAFTDCFAEILPRNEWWVSRCLQQRHKMVLESR